MALTYNELNTVSHDFYDKVITKQVYDDCPILKILDSKKKIKEMGIQLRWPIRYREYARAQSINPRQQIDYQPKETRTTAVETYAYYEVDTSVFLDERVANYGEGQVVDLAKDKLEELRDDMKEKLADAWFVSSPGTYDLASLHEIVDSGTTYGGIAVADASAWASTEISSSNATELFIHGQYGLSYAVAATTKAGGYVTHHLTTPDLWNKYESLIEPNRIYEDKETANLGFMNVTYRGKPVIHDHHCTANYWFGVDINALEVRVHPLGNKKLYPWEEMTTHGYPGTLTRVMLWIGQVMCRRRVSMFKYSGLDYTA